MLVLFLKAVLSEQQLDNFRQEVEVDGLSSYPHPWLMGDFWQFPTVSMGLGPLQAIYQARFLKYLENRGLVKSEGVRFGLFSVMVKWMSQNHRGFDHCCA